VDNKTYYRLEHTFRPYTLTTAAWSGYTTLLQYRWDKFKDLFKRKESDPPDEATSLHQHPSIDPKTFNRAVQKPGSRFSDAVAASMVSTAPTAPTRQVSNGSDSEAVYTKKEKESPNEEDLLRCPPYISIQLCESIAPAIIAFRKTLRKNRQRPYNPPGRGCLRVSGMIEFEGPKAVYVYDVQAFYDPKSSNWDTVHLYPRRAAPKAQAPLGGR
jgi:hypothetical protein